MYNEFIEMGSLGAENEPASEDESAHDSCEQESSEAEDGDLRKRKKAPSRRKFR